MDCDNNDSDKTKMGEMDRKLFLSVEYFFQEIYHFKNCKYILRIWHIRVLFCLFFFFLIDIFVKLICWKFLKFTLIIEFFLFSVIDCDLAACCILDDSVSIKQCEKIDYLKDKQKS